MNVVARAFILVGVFEVFKAIGDAAYEASVTVRKFAGGLVGIAKVMAGFATGGREGMMAAYAEVQDYVKALDDEVAAEKRAAKAREDAAKKSAAAWEKAKGSALPGSEVAGESRRLAARGAAAAQDRENALLPKKPILLAADDTKKAEAEARRAQKAYEALLRTVDRGLDAMELKGAKGGARELEEALAAIDQQYEQLYEKIEQLNAADRKAALARAETAKELIKANTRVEFERKAAAERLSGIEAERDALLEAAKARAEVDPSAALQVQQELIEITTRYRDRVIEAAEAALLLAEAQGRIADAAKFRATITKAKAFDPQAETRKAQITDLQKQLDLQTQLRDAQIARVQAQVDPTGVDTAAETARIMAEFQGRLPPSPRRSGSWRRPAATWRSWADRRAERQAGDHRPARGGRAEPGRAVLRQRADRGVHGVHLRDRQVGARCRQLLGRLGGGARLGAQLRGQLFADARADPGAESALNLINGLLGGVRARTSWGRRNRRSGRACWAASRSWRPCTTAASSARPAAGRRAPRRWPSQAPRASTAVACRGSPRTKCPPSCSAAKKS